WPRPRPPGTPAPLVPPVTATAAPPGPHAGSQRAATPATPPPAGAWPACVPPAPADRPVVSRIRLLTLNTSHGNGGIVMAAVVAPSQIRPLRPEGHKGELARLKPGGRQQFWYTVLGRGLAVGAFFAAWGLHGSASSPYRIDNQWSALTGLFILALAIERALEPFSRKLGPDTTKLKAQRDEALAGGRAAGQKGRVPEFQDAIEIQRRLTAVVTSGVRTAL